MGEFKTKNESKAAFPLTDGITFVSDGLTKREYFAGLAMQGLISKGEDMRYNPNDIANYAVDYADELLKELENQK